jgi:hypothetical protein
MRRTERFASGLMTPATARLVASLESIDRAGAEGRTGSHLRRPGGVPDAEWGAVVAEADAHGLAPALAFALRLAGRPELPLGTSECLAHGLAQSTGRHVVLARALERVVARLAAGGIPVIALKGPLLAEMIYPHPGIRPSSDLDVLVRPADSVPVDATLRALGYRPFADDPPEPSDVDGRGAVAYDGPDGVRLDLHWRLVTEPRFVWDEAEARGIWVRARPVRFGAGRVLSLAPDDLVLYLAVHLATHHGLGGLVWAWDIARLVGDERWPIDWDTVVERARRWRVARAVYFALDEACRTFGAAVPAAVLARLRPRGPRAGVLRAVLARADADHRARLEHAIALLVIDRAPDLMRSLARTVWPGSERWRPRHGAPGSLVGARVAHARRLVVVGATIAGALAGLARRSPR